MPLSDGYGVVIGTLASYSIEPPDDQGRWPHFQLYIDTLEGEYECVINLKSRTDIKLEYRAFMSVNRNNFINLWNLENRYHPLLPNPNSGALDVVRHKGLNNPICRPKDHIVRSPWPFPFTRSYPFIRLRDIEIDCTQWWRENGINLVKLMEYYLERVERLYVFGEPYTDGRLGMHNIHMNQGDPIGSQWSEENGIWQDGGVIYQYNNPQQKWSILLTKFETQTFETGDNGQPI